MTSSTEHNETVVIGGGQAGLIAGYELKRRGREFVILDARNSGTSLCAAIVASSSAAARAVGTLSAARGRAADRNGRGVDMALRETQQPDPGSTRRRTWRAPARRRRL